jgi:flagellar basal body P-ring formation protein FlgA
MRRFLASILIPTGAVFAGAALATAFHPTEAIRDAALAAVGGGPGVRTEASVDASIRLPLCGEPLQATVGNGGTVEVGCPTAGWRLFVPVRIQRFEDVWVLTRPLAAGQPVPADAIRAESRDVARITGGALTVATAVEGQVARRSLMAGSVLQAQDLLAPRAIRRGDAVTLVSRVGAIEVRAAGRALGEAGVAERISVQNLASRRIVQGRVRSSGEVEIVH